MNTTPHEIRKLRYAFWKEKKHAEAKPSSLVPAGEDKTVIFNVAWMQPLVPYLTGKPHPKGTRLYNIQRCIRTGDIEEVWLTERHCTFFEMMGNWSLWDYFKKESLTRSIEFLVKHLNLNINKLWCSIFWWLFDENGKELVPYDQEAEDILLANGITKEKIKAIPMHMPTKCDNWRWPAWPIGPCGPSAEFHYDRGEEWGPSDRNIGENDRYVEIWNNVFMEFYKDEDGKFSPLSQQNIDTGMGFERLNMVLQNKETIFETSLFSPIIDQIEKIVGQQYPSFVTKFNDQSPAQIQVTRSFRIVAEHMRSVAILLMDWVIPSNESRGYVARRLIRRAYYHLTKLFPQHGTLDTNHSIKNIIETLYETIEKEYQQAYPGLTTAKQSSIATLTKEMEQFEKTIKKWRKILEDYLEKSSNKKLDWSHAFKLYDTYGFPVELTQEITDEKWFSVDMESFQKHMEDAKKLAKSSSQKMFNKDIDWANYLQWIDQTEFIGRTTTNQEDCKIIKNFVVHDQRVIILDKTPFYAESGWQTGDKWILVDENNKKRHVTDVKKYDGVFLHFVEEE